MGSLSILLQMVHLVTALLELWRSGGSDVVKSVLAENHKRVCDERCQVDLKRAAQGENK